MAKAKAVYLLTKGDYSDYRVCGAFSTRKKAKAVMERNHLNRDCGIERYVLDKIEPIPEGFKGYQVKMQRDGTAKWVRPSSIDESASLNAGEHFFSLDSCLLMLVVAKNQKHAIKIANEKRAQLIANNEWPKENKNNG